MTVAAQMLDTYPKDLGGIDREKLRTCIDACTECAQACTACGDACLSEDTVAQLTKCIRTCAACADVCDTTGRVLSRHTSYDANLTRAGSSPAPRHARPAATSASSTRRCTSTAGCANACRRCEQARRDLIAGLGQLAWSAAGGTAPASDQRPSWASNCRVSFTLLPGPS
jgi:hypothetical protein